MPPFGLALVGASGRLNVRPRYGRTRPSAATPFGPNPGPLGSLAARRPGGGLSNRLPMATDSNPVCNRRGGGQLAELSTGLLPLFFKTTPFSSDQSGSPSGAMTGRGSRRFIPACAGNRRFQTLAPRSSSVHPRVRGEQGRECPAGRASCGSSPRARGTARKRFRGGPYNPVHPRVRGEQDWLSPVMAPDRGSSPRARGTALPARGCRWRRLVHPRVRGEQSW